MRQTTEPRQRRGMSLEALARRAYVGGRRWRESTAEEKESEHETVWTDSEVGHRRSGGAWSCGSSAGASVIRTRGVPESGRAWGQEKGRSCKRGCVFRRNGKDD